MEKIYPNLDLILLVIIVIFLLLFFIRTIGKRVGLQKRETVDLSSTNVVNEVKQIKPSSQTKEGNNVSYSESFTEGSLNYKIAKIKQLDESFDFREFINYSKEAFQSIILGFNNAALDDSEKYLSSKMYNSYKHYIEENNIKNNVEIDKFVIVDIIDVEFEEKIINIKVKFVTKQKINNISIENREIWLFTKDTSNTNSLWVLSKVLND